MGCERGLDLLEWICQQHPCPALASRHAPSPPNSDDPCLARSQAIYKMNESLHKDLLRKPNNDEMAATMNMRVSQFRQHLEVGTTAYGLWYPMGTSLDLIGYSDADWAGSADGTKSTSGACFYIGHCLVAWHSKKQNCIPLSIAEAEYISAGSCSTQLLWMKSLLSDYRIPSTTLTILCDNTSAITISKNPVLHSRTKHIELKYHFLRELVESNVLQLEYISTENQLADILTKPLDQKRFLHLRKAIGMNPSI
uniref:Copia protein n=1 Tax=Ananas comosus var. bracteatus TaxID=296719 RepID=A0A6V7PS17_ANACO|nr:unnamed protein product [Ananas comosus var. bracteatus]